MDSLKRFLKLPKQLLEWWSQIGELVGHYNLARIQILKEFLRLRGKTGISFEEYRSYGLHDPDMAWSKKTSYWPSRWKYLRKIYRVLNPESYYCLFNNKLIFKRYFTAANLPLAKMYGVFDPDLGTAEDGRPLRSVNDLVELFRRETEGGGLVVKHVEGAQGKQVLVFVGHDAEDPSILISIEGKRYSPDALLAEIQSMESRFEPGLLHTWIVEERLKLHPEIARLCGSTLACFRMQTLIGVDNQPRLIGCVLKIPNETRSSDNLHYGGIAVGVEPETGTLGRGRLFTEVDVRWHSSLPWNGQKFQGLRIPHWEAAKKIANQAALAFPWARCIGWDIAITTSGPVIVEGNELGSPHLVQSVAPQGLFVDDMRFFFNADGKFR